MSSQANSTSLDSLAQCFVGESNTAKAIVESGLPPIIAGRLATVKGWDVLRPRLLLIDNQELTCTIVDIAAVSGVHAALYGLNLAELQGVKPRNLLPAIARVNQVRRQMLLVVRDERIWSELAEVVHVIDSLKLPSNDLRKLEMAITSLFPLTQDGVLPEIVNNSVSRNILLDAAKGGYIPLLMCRLVVELTPSLRATASQIIGNLTKLSKIPRNTPSDPQLSNEPAILNDQTLELLDARIPILSLLNETNGESAINKLKLYLGISLDTKDSTILDRCLSLAQNVGEALAIGRMISFGLDDNVVKDLLTKSRMAPSYAIHDSSFFEDFKRTNPKNSVPRGTIHERALVSATYVDPTSVFAVALMPTITNEENLSGEKRYLLATGHVPGSLAYAFVKPVKDTLQILELQIDARGKGFEGIQEELSNSLELLVSCVEEIAKREGYKHVQITPPFLQLTMWPSLRLKPAAKIYAELPSHMGYELKKHHPIILGVEKGKQKMSRFGWVKSI